MSSFKGIHWSKHRRPVKWRNNDGSKSSDNSNTLTRLRNTKWNDDETLRKANEIDLIEVTCIQLYLHTYIYIYYIFINMYIYI